MKTQTCPQRNNRQAGFTLIEMLVVLTVMGLLAAVAVAQRPGGESRFARQKAGLQLQSAIRQAAREARQSGTERRVQLSGIAAGASIGAASASAPGGRDVLVFYPDGSSNGGTVLLGGTPLLSVDWLSGQVSHAR